MAHPRTAIRNKVVELLLGRTDVAGSVYASRVKPFLSNDWQNELPAIVVYTMDENGEIYTAAPREYLRTVEVVVEVHANADEALDDVLDTIGRQVERLLLTDDTLDGAVNDFTYSRTKLVIRDDGDDLMGGCRIIFDAEYLDRHPDDLFNQTLPDLNTVVTDYSLNNTQADPADRARTIIEDLNQ